MDKSGQAFPQAGHDHLDSNDFGGRGMSLRQYYAGQALAGECVNDSNGNGWAFDRYGDLAKKCFNIADALIAEGSKDA